MPSRRVLVDLRMVKGRLHGIARYALELVRRLPVLAPEWKFAVLTGPQGLPSLGRLEPSPQLERVPCRAEFLSVLEQPALAASLFEYGPDLFHATSFSVPALWPGPLVATIHDANHLALRSNYGAGRVAYYRLIVSPRAKRARALLTDSEFSRRELAQYLRLPPERFQVIFPGVDPSFAPPTDSELADFRARYRLPPRYLAAVGNSKRHKNLALLARIANGIEVPIALLAGDGAAAALGFPRSAIELPEISDEDLPRFYGGAAAVLVPSRYEGFGLPALEAMACGAPVIASSAASLPEVVGGAAVQVDPEDDAAWAEAILRVLRDERQRDELRRLGRERAARFTWDECARQTLAVYRRVLG